MTIRLGKSELSHEGPVNVESLINIFVRNILKFTRLGKMLSVPFFRSGEKALKTEFPKKYHKGPHRF